VYDNPDGSTSTDVYNAAGRRYVERTAEIGQIFQNVLGADPTHQRIRPVLGWQNGVYSYFSADLYWYEHFFGPAATAFYGLRAADYMYPTDGSSVTNLLASLQQRETSASIPNTVAYTALATFYGLHNVSYEGGPSIGGDGNTAAGQIALGASRDPGIEPLILLARLWSSPAPSFPRVAASGRSHQVAGAAAGAPRT
jgi:hypothetical protein